MKKQPNKITLGDRMKKFESVTTDTSLVPGIPVYVRLDGRSFHTFCNGLNKPFDMHFVEIMQEVTKYLHDKTGAAISYVQSDEISLGYLEPSKMPFDGRLFKIQSVFAGMASSMFTYLCLKSGQGRLIDRVERLMPHFDCRVCQMSLSDMAGMFLFRSLDCLKNSVTMVAQSKFSHKRLQGVNTADKKKMLKDIYRIDYDNDYSEDLRYGTYFVKVNYEKTLTEEEVARIPPKNRNVDENGKIVCMRSEVRKLSLGRPLVDIENRVGVLFSREEPVFKENPEEIEEDD